MYDRFVELAAERARKRVVGDPYDAKTQQGPQARCAAGLRCGGAAGWRSCCKAAAICRSICCEICCEIC